MRPGGHITTGEFRHMKQFVLKLKANHALDCTMVNLLTILVGGAGIFTALTGFNVPELNLAYLDQNPFAIKRDAIEDVLTWLFASLAVLALFLQVVAGIWGERLSERVHSRRYYFWFSVGVFITISLLVWALTTVGKSVAKSVWWPKVVSGQTEGFRSAEFLIEHDGWRSDQLAIKSELPAENRKVNLQGAEDRIADIEKLLELPPMKADIRTRMARLKPYFK
jgi:hypothetical protein